MIAMTIAGADPQSRRNGNQANQRNEGVGITKRADARINAPITGTSDDVFSCRIHPCQNTIQLSVTIQPPTTSAPMPSTQRMDDMASEERNVHALTRNCSRDAIDRERDQIEIQNVGLNRHGRYHGATHVPSQRMLSWCEARHFRNETQPFIDDFCAERRWTLLDDVIEELRRELYGCVAKVSQLASTDCARERCRNANLEPTTVEANDVFIFGERDFRVCQAAKQIPDGDQQERCEVTDRNPSPTRIKNGIVKRQRYVAKRTTIVQVISGKLTVRCTAVKVEDHLIRSAVMTSPL
jgi:hypothetical protein